MGRPNNESLRVMGLEVTDFTTSGPSKENIISRLAGAFERGDIRILPDSVLIGELQAYEGIRQAAGHVKYGAPEGMHDDTVMALAFAWWGVEAEPPVLTGDMLYEVATPARRRRR